MQVKVFFLDVINDLIFQALPSSEDILITHANKEYMMVKVSDLQHYYSILEWKTLLSSISGLPIDDNTAVQVYFFEYFIKLFKLLQGVSSK